jgi:hypothetical protein
MWSAKLLILLFSLAVFAEAAIDSDATAASVSVPVLYAPDEVVTVTEAKDEYCGAAAGKNHYEGSYSLRLGKFSTPVAGSFDEETPHDKAIHEITLSSDPHERFFAFYQYVSCNH